MSRNLVDTMHRTTADLPAGLPEPAQRLVQEGAPRSRNRVIVTALERYLDQMEREAIDAQFAAMATDESYQRLMVSLAEELAKSDWEALNEVGHATRGTSSPLPASLSPRVTP